MKKKFYVAAVASVLLLSGCSDPEQQALPETTQIEIQIQETTENSEVKSENEEMKYVSEKMALASYASCTETALSDIGFRKITDVNFQKVEVTDDGDINLEIVVEDSGERTISLSCFYSSLVDLWAVGTITNPDNGHTYWVQENVYDYYDIYDYGLDKLYHAKVKDFDLDEFMERVNEENNEIQSEFEDNLNDLADKYNVNR